MTKKEKASKAVADKTVKLLSKATKQLSKIEKLLDKTKVSDSVKSVVAVSALTKAPKQKEKAK